MDTPIIKFNVISFDPSGNFSQGKGTTGYVRSYIVFKDKLDKKMQFFEPKEIKAKDFSTAEDYQSKHLDLIDPQKVSVVLVEDFIGNPQKRGALFGSKFETAQMVGFLKRESNTKGIFLKVFPNNYGKTMKHDTLVALGILTKEDGKYYWNGIKVSKHIRDAMCLSYVFFQRMTTDQAREISARSI